MTRHVLSCSLFLAASVALAAPPEVPKKVEVQAGQLYSLTVKGNGKVAFIPAFDTADAFFAEFVTPTAGNRMFAFHSQKPGQYVVVFITEGDKTGAYTIFTVAGTPPVPPGPNPPGPTPDPPSPANPAPIPVAGFRVLIVYESADAAKTSAGQQAIMYGQTTRAILNSRCVVGPDGKTREWRIWDKDTATAGEAKLWQDALARAKQKATVLPWMILSNGVTGFEGPLSPNPAEFAAMLAKYAPATK